MEIVPPEFTVPASDILAVMKPSVEQGMSVRRLLNDLSLPTTLLDEPDRNIPLSDCWRIMIGNQNAIQEESHLMSSRPLRKGTTRLVFSNFQHCNTVVEGMRALAETYNIVHGGDYNFVRKHGRFLSFVTDDRHFHYAGPSSHFAIEFALLRIHCALSISSGRALKVLRVCTRRSVLPPGDHHLKLFDARCIPNHPVYEIAYDAAQMSLAIRCDDGMAISGNIHDQFMELLSRAPSQNDDLVRAVRSLITEGSLQSHLPNQEDVADRLNMSVATLRRKLVDRSTSFRQLLDEVTRELAVNLLEDKIKTHDIAERLGYSDLRSFKRAFKRWYGVSPTEYLESRNHQ